MSRVRVLLMIIAGMYAFELFLKEEEKIEVY